MVSSTSEIDRPIWLLLDDRPGNRSQCLGVAHALDLEFREMNLDYGWAGRLPNFLLGASFAGLSAGSRDALRPPWPDAVIAAGRRTAPVARNVKQLSGDRTKIIQIMHPGGAVGEIDLIAVPNHDAVADAPNILKTTGAPHGLTAEILAKAAQEWGARLSGFPKPRVALIVGGSTRRRRFTDGMARELGWMTSNMAAEAGGSVLVTTSRRTGSAADALIGEIEVPARVHRWGEGDDNPYQGFLALADAVVVSGESMSMVSEACAVPSPVYIYGPQALITAKHRRFHDELFERGYARPFDGTFAEWTHPPLNAAADIAAAIRLVLAD